MRLILAGLALALFGVTASADSFDTVTLAAPVTWGLYAPEGGETLSAFKFDWDVTTGALSNFVITGTGTLIQSINPTPVQVVYTPYGLDYLFFSGTNSVGLEISVEGIDSGTVLPSAPGTYARPLFLFGQGMSEESEGSFVVTAAPEPATLTLLAIGLTGAVLGKRKRSDRNCKSHA